MATPTLAPQIATTPRTPSRAIVVYAWLVLAFLILVVLWGAVVRASGSGAGCGANWPLCNGDFVPRHPRLATIIEFTHRSMSGISTVMVIAMMIWTFLATAKGNLARRAVVASGVLLITEGFFGAVLVLRHLVEHNTSLERVIMQSIHFTNTMLLLAAITLTAVFLGRSRRPDPRASAPGLKPLTIGAVAATIVVGATGSLAALADTLFPSTNLIQALAQDFAASAPVLVRMRWVHPASAAIGLLCVLLLVLKMKTPAAKLTGALLVMQIVLGVGDVLLLAPTWMQVLHLFGADFYWVALVALAADALWPRSTAGQHTFVTTATA